MRTSGILMPIFSLPSPYGIGTLGQEAFHFVDFLKKAGQRYWQILPIGVTGFGDSPYQCFSAYAGNPYFIDLDLLAADGLLDREDAAKLDWGESSEKIDYERLYRLRYPLLRKAYQLFSKRLPADFETFCRENAFWLDDYALYMAIKNENGGKSFFEWAPELKLREADAIERARKTLSEELGFQKMLQYLFDRQWRALKTYANKNGIQIIGDIPIYVAPDSADVWSEPDQFQLDEALLPTAVAGCPPDAFSEDGQLWGNPLYRWDRMAEDDFSWWVKRMAYAAKLFDVVRIDHFRAFSAYFSIPAGDKTAANGRWITGPGQAFFDVMNRELGRLSVIAEDLGTIDQPVRELLRLTGYPGMKVLQFAFDPNSESSYLPHNIPKNCVVYTGTHDNDTAIGFLEEQDPKQVAFMREYLRIGEQDSFNWSLIKAAMACAADTVILQMQDFLGLDNTARINKPSTMENNWQWRIAPGCINDWLADIIRSCTKTYFRLAVPEKKQECYKT